MYVNKSNLKDFVTYLDDNLFSEHLDKNALKNAVDILLEFYKKNDFVDEIAELMSELSDTKKFENTFDAISIGYYLGLIMGKYSEKIKVQNNGL